MPGWEVISWQVVIFLPLAALATAGLWPRDIGGVPLSAWAGLGYVGLVSQYTAFFVFNAARQSTSKPSCLPRLWQLWC
jgi:drug/metabolite transporter (DMT)-like permease